MFTVTTLADPIEMLTMEIYANPIGAAMDVEIYTKLGDFTGAENDPSQWKQIVNTTLVPAREGHGTIIPTTEFRSIKMNENEIHAFFVTLKTSDLRYKRGADSMPIGQAFVSDGYLSINSGIGISEYGFSTNIFPSRLFSGIFHYTHPSDCSEPASKLLITYSFHARPKGGTGASMTNAQIIDAINSLVESSVTDLLNSGLSAVRDEYRVTVESVDSVEASSQGATCPVRGWSDCILIDCQISLMHLDTISGGNLQYMLLNDSSDVTTKVQQGSLDVNYAGLSTVQTSIVVALKGASVGVALDEKQQYFVEAILTSYLVEKTVGLMNAVVCGASIVSQRGPKVGRRQIRNLQDASSGDGWIELTVDVFATLTPPYTGGSSFDEVLLSTFRSSQQDFITDLQTDFYQPEFQLNGKLGDYFVGINQVNVRSVGTSPSGSPSVKIMGLSKAAFSVVCVAAIVVTGVWIWRWYRKSKRSDTGEVIYVDSTGRRRRRSSVLFMLNGNKGTLTEKGLKIGEVLSNHEARATRMESVDQFESTHSRSRSAENNYNAKGTQSPWGTGTSHEVRGEVAGRRLDSIEPKSQSGVERSSSIDNGEKARVAKVSRPDVSRSAHKRQQPERSNLHEHSRHRSGDYAPPSRGSSQASTLSSVGITSGHDEDLAAALRMSIQQEKLQQMRAPSSSVHTRREDLMPSSTNHSRVSTMSNSSHQNRSVGANADGHDEDLALALRISIQEEKLRQMRVSSSAHARREGSEPLSRKNSRGSNMANSSHHNRSLEANFSGADLSGANAPTRINTSSTFAQGDSQHTTRGQRTFHNRDSASETEHDKELAAALRLSIEEKISRSPREEDEEINDALLRSIHDGRLRQMHATSSSAHSRRGELAPGSRYPPVDMNARPTMGKNDNRSFRGAASSHNRQPPPFANENSVHSTRASRTPVSGRQPSHASESAPHSRPHETATMRIARTSMPEASTTGDNAMRISASARGPRSAIPPMAQYAPHGLDQARPQTSQSMRQNRTTGGFT